jgi:hypothetical protein
LVEHGVVIGKHGRNTASQQFSGAPGGDWFHIEITPQAADSVIFVKAAFLKVFGEIPPKA